VGKCTPVCAFRIKRVVIGKECGRSAQTIKPPKPLELPRFAYEPLLGLREKKKEYEFVTGYLDRSFRNCHSCCAIIKKTEEEATDSSREANNSPVNQICKKAN